MAEGATPVVPSHELLEWPKQDKRRFLHAVYRVGDLDRTIKYVVHLRDIMFVYGLRYSFLLLVLVFIFASLLGFTLNVLG